MLPVPGWLSAEHWINKITDLYKNRLRSIVGTSTRLGACKVDVIKTKLPSAPIIEPKVFGDARGFFLESYHRRRYREIGIELSGESPCVF